MKHLTKRTIKDESILPFLALTYSNKSLRALNTLFCKNILKIPNTLLIKLIKKYLPDSYNTALKKYPDLIEKKITVWPLTHEQYPVGLKLIPDPPMSLFLQGNESLLNRNLIGIVGTRKPSTFSRLWVGEISRFLGAKELVTISGLAAGIDSAVHESSLDNGTIGVIAHGFNHVYPKCNKRFFDMSLCKENILLVSEHPPERSARKHYFVKRNRIIAAMSSWLLFVEGSERSGALTTVNYSLKLNKPTLYLNHELQSGNGGVLDLANRGARDVTSWFPVQWRKEDFQRNLIRKISQGWVYVGNKNWFKVDVDNFLKEWKLPV